MKQLKVLTKLQEIRLLVFLFQMLFFLTPSINTPESYDFMILLMSVIYSFEINIVNRFPALTAPFPLIFLSNIFIALFPKLHKQEPKDLPD